MRLTPIYNPQEFKPFEVIDIESMNWTKFLVLGWTNGYDYLEFKKLSDFTKYLKTKTDNTVIFAHFGGKFDFMFLFKEFLKDKSLVIKEIVPRGSMILSFKIITNNCEIVFRDSSALLPFSLKSLTENFDVETKKGEWDHTKTKGYTKKLGAYLKSDCLGLHQVITKFYQWPLIQNSGPAITIAGQANKVFRTFINKEYFKLAKSTTDFCRKAYLGGRTEIFRPLCKSGPLYEYDVNSLYPFVMRENFFPVNKGIFTFEYEKNHLGIYSCEIDCPETEYLPCLGVIHEGKYIFPKGRFKGHFTSVEIEYAKTLGYKIKILEGYYFPRKEKLFTDYVNKLYQIRLDSKKNSVDDILAKLLMNSLYGRMGMNLDKENIEFIPRVGSKDMDIIIKSGKDQYGLFKKPVQIKSFTHVAIAAFVTAYARIHMHKLMYPIRDSVYYTDTDSIFTTKKLKSGKALGELKLENEYESAVFLLPKTYLADGVKKKIAMKGFDKRKIQGFSIEDFKHALDGDLKRLKITTEAKFASFKMAVRKGDFLTLLNASSKELRAKYDKRLIIKNGDNFDTIPVSI